MRHPEQRPDEVFVGNMQNLSYVGFTNKRMGRIAYDITGKMLDPINGLFPIFVATEDIIAAGLDPKNYDQ